MSKFIWILLLFILVSCNGGSPTTNPSFGQTDNQTPDETPTSAEVSAVHSSIVSSGNIVANGISTAIVTITLKTSSNVAVPNIVPLFSATDSGSTNVYGACTSSNTNGVSTCTLASSTPEIKQLQLTSPVSVIGGSVTFIHDNVDISASYITGDDNIVADGSTTSTIRIKLIDNSGSPYAGIPTFRATNSGTTNSYGTCSALNGAGESTCSLTSLKAETKQLEILSPAYLAGSVIHFVSGAISSAQSTITSASTPVSDGASAALLKISLKDANGNAVAGSTPTYSATDTGSSNVYGPCSQSNSAGESFCSMTSRKAETKTLSLLTPVSVVGGTVVFSPGAATAANSSITGTTNVIANGTAFSQVTITLQDAGANAIAGVTPTFVATDSGNDNDYGACSVTNASGVSTCELRSLSPEAKTLRITSPVFKDDQSVTFLSPGMNIMVPIDLIDRGVSSNTAAVIFDRSLYPLTTSDYVGTSTDYYFEIIALNSHATNSYTVNLLGNSNTVLSTVAIPANTTAYSRFRSTAITMPAGTNNLKIRVNATAVANQVQVVLAKLIVKQVDATETKIWIPLSGFDHSGYSNAALAAIFQSASATYTNNLTYTTQWNRNDSLYTDLDTSAYKFETLMSTNNASRIASAYLYNTSDSAIVTGSTVNVTGTAYQWASTSLTDSATFANNKNYEVRFRVDNAAGIAYLFKAGISIKLKNLSKAEILNRIYMRRSSASSAMLGGGRLLWEADDYFHAKTFLETYGSITVGGSASRELDDHGTSDSSVATPIVVDNSVTNITSTLGPHRSSEIELSDGNRVGVYDRVNSGTFNAIAGFLVIQATLR
jgi:hypothetical protein